MKTTLNKIRDHKPCKSGWEKLLTYLGKTKADDEPLAITTVLDSNGLDDALWCLRAVEGKDREIRLFVVWCARQVQHLMKDQRSLDALDVAERYANGEATEEELRAASTAASAARVVAGAAARDAAWHARSVSAASAAASAAWAAAGAAEAAMDAADAARDAAAVGAAWDASAAVSAADDYNEMKDKQEAELRRICEEVVSYGR